MQFPIPFKSDSSTRKLDFLRTVFLAIIDKSTYLSCTQVLVIGIEYLFLIILLQFYVASRWVIFRRLKKKQPSCIYPHICIHIFAGSRAGMRSLSSRLRNTEGPVQVASADEKKRRRQCERGGEHAPRRLHQTNGQNLVVIFLEIKSVR